MKSVLEVVRGLYSAILMDLQMWHPSIRDSLVRDFTRLRDAESSRGLPFYTIDLPEANKWLQSSLGLGYLEDPRPFMCGRRAKTDQRPLLMKSLFDLIFKADGTLRPDVEPDVISSLRQVFLAVKKLRMDCKVEYIEEAIDAFSYTEFLLPTSHLETWDDNTPTWKKRFGHPIWGPSVDDDLFGDLTGEALDFDPRWGDFRTLCGVFTSQLGDFDPFAIRPKHGPGAVADPNEEYVKYDLRSWTDKLQPVFPYDWHGAPDLSVPSYVQYEEFPSRLISVPKDQSGPRLIAAEPTAHQWIQQGIFRWIEERLKRTFLKSSIDFRDQGASQRLALEGSRSGEFCTVDLKSASDRLTTRLVEFVFQGNHNLLDALHASRTRTTRLPSGELLRLRKFATQGSALTFPIQSIVFSLVAIHAVSLAAKKEGWRSATIGADQVRVFGDDIIVPTYAYPVLVALLESLFLRVNRTKSHATGKFRESCGMDAYDGVDVTPAYFREVYSSSPTSLESVVECSNNFHKKGFWHSADFIQKTVPPQERKKLPVVGVGDGVLGFSSFVGRCLDHLPSRWNNHLHREEHLVLTTRTKVVLRDGQGHGGLNQFFHEEPDPLLPYRSGQVHRVVPRKGRDWVSL